MFISCYRYIIPHLKYDGCNFGKLIQTTMLSDKADTAVICMVKWFSPEYHIGSIALFNERSQRNVYKDLYTNDVIGGLKLYH